VGLRIAAPNYDPASHGMERLADGSQILSAGLG
jgi:hypothetical protein